MSLTVIWRYPELVFSQHFLKIVVEVKALGPSHVLNLWLGVSKGMLPVECSLFLCQLNFMEIMRLSQSWGESGHPPFRRFYRI